MIEEIFAERLKELRVGQELSQKELASHIGLTQRKVSKLETLQLLPSPQVIASVARFFGVSADYLLGLEE